MLSKDRWAGPISAALAALPRAGERCLAGGSGSLFLRPVYTSTAHGPWPSQLMVSPRNERCHLRRNLVLPACLKRTPSSLNHSDLPLLQIPKMILSDAFSFPSCFQNTWRSMWAQPRPCLIRASNPAQCLAPQLEVSQYQSPGFWRLCRARSAQTISLNSPNSPDNIGAILVPILHTELEN